MDHVRAALRRVLGPLAAAEVGVVVHLLAAAHTPTVDRVLVLRLLRLSRERL